MLCPSSELCWASGEAPSVWDSSVVTREESRAGAVSLSLSALSQLSPAVSKQTSWPARVSTRWMLGEQTLSRDVVITDRLICSEVSDIPLWFSDCTLIGSFQPQRRGRAEINIINSITELWDVLLRDLSEQEISKRFSKWDFCRNYFKQSCEVKRDLKLTAGEGSALVWLRLCFRIR